MFCSSCGIDSVEGLKYCKRCGASLSGTSGSPAPKRFPLTLAGLVLLVIGGVAALGLSAPLFMARDLVRSGFTPKHVVILFFFSSVVTLAIIALLLPVLMRLIGMSRSAEDIPLRHEHQVRSYEAPQSLATPQPVVSVTENTTRSFEPRRFEGNTQS